MSNEVKPVDLKRLEAVTGMVLLADGKTSAKQVRLELASNGQAKYPLLSDLIVKAQDSPDKLSPFGNTGETPYTYRQALTAALLDMVEMSEPQKAACVVGALFGIDIHPHAKGLSAIGHTEKAIQEYLSEATPNKRGRKAADTEVFILPD